jgi:prepilin signal peptidase PulO-like enzyme (type II secretory pathway)
MEWRLVGGALALAFGSALGSFANVLVIRMREASSLWGRSACVHCKTPIAAKHLVPVLSWFVLGGKCASCGRPIHIQYPLVEGLAGLFALMAFLRHNPLDGGAEAGLFLFELLFSMSLLVLVAFDWRWKLLPLEFMAGSTIVFAVWRMLGGVPFSSVAIGTVVGAGFLGVQVLLSRGKWMGSGDPWAGALVGAALGWPGVGFALYLTYIIGGLAAVYLLLSGIVRRGTRIPFVPLLASGALLALWFEPSLLRLVDGMFV